jgi:hypothetical protein
MGRLQRQFGQVDPLEIGQQVGARRRPGSGDGAGTVGLARRL